MHSDKICKVFCDLIFLQREISHYSILLLFEYDQKVRFWWLKCSANFLIYMHLCNRGHILNHKCRYFLSHTIKWNYIHLGWRKTWYTSFFPPEYTISLLLYLCLSSIFFETWLHDPGKSRNYRVRKGSVTVRGDWSSMNKPANQHKGRERRENIGRYIGETPSRKQMVHWVNWEKLSKRIIYKD